MAAHEAMSAAGTSLISRNGLIAAYYNLYPADETDTERRTEQIGLLRALSRRLHRQILTRD